MNYLITIILKIKEKGFIPISVNKILNTKKVNCKDYHSIKPDS